MKNWIVAVAALVVFSTGCASQKAQLRMGDTHASLANLTGLDGDPLAKQPVEYEVTGKANYDKFFKDAAVFRAGLVVSNSFAETLTTNVKNYARSYMASGAVSEEAKKIAGSTPAEKLSDDQALAVLKAAKTSLQIDQLKYLASSGANALQLGVYLTESVKSAKDLVVTGKDLTQKVKTDFTGMDMTKAAGVTSALAGSVDNLNEGAQKAPELAKTLTRLGQGLAAIGG